MSTSIKSERLELGLLSENDATFIIELLNTEGWLKFIGDRNIHNETDAIAYIQKIKGNPNITYWTVRIAEAQRTIGLVTLIQRDYLDQPDIGFAFLPDFSNKGYAYEAVSAVLRHLVQIKIITSIFAETLPENTASIKLIKKLGLKFEREMTIEKDVLHIYKAVVEQLLLK